MKILKLLLLILFISQSSEIFAPKSDTTTLMKRKSRIFIAEIETYSGTQNGILYEADSSEIVILNHLYQRIIIPLSEIKTLKIKSLKAGKRGFEAGFYPFITLTTLLVGIPIISSGLPAAGSWAALGLTTITVVGIGSGLLIGGILAVLSANTPAFNIDMFKYPEKYRKQLKYIKLKTQEVLIRKHPKKVRLICLDCVQ